MANAERIMRQVDFEQDVPNAFGADASKQIAKLWNDERKRYPADTVHRRPPLAIAVPAAFADTKMKYVTLAYLIQHTGHRQNLITKFMTDSTAYRTSLLTDDDGGPLYMRKTFFAAVADLWHFFLAVNYWTG